MNWAHFVSCWGRWKGNLRFVPLVLWFLLKGSMHVFYIIVSGRLEVNADPHSCTGDRSKCLHCALVCRACCAGRSRDASRPGHDAWRIGDGWRQRVRGLRSRQPRVSSSPRRSTPSRSATSMRIPEAGEGGREKSDQQHSSRSRGKQRQKSRPGAVRPWWPEEEYSLYRASARMHADAVRRHRSTDGERRGCAPRHPTAPPPWGKRRSAPKRGIALRVHATERVVGRQKRSTAAYLMS